MNFKSKHAWTMMALVAVLGGSTSIFAQSAFLVVNRETGALDVVSNGNLDVDGYSITSPAGRLNPESWNSLQDQGLAGWEEANPNSQGISELNWTSSSVLNGGEMVSLGSPYNGGAILPAQEDVAFSYSIAAGDTQPGIVHYTGASPLPTISVERSSGLVTLSNPGNFPITGYSISSADGSMNAEQFNGLADQNVPDWTEANPLGDLISELSLTGEVGFDGGASFDLGNIYGGGDLSLQYSTPAGDIAQGVVDFVGAIPDLVLQVDIFSGEAKIQNLSSTAGPFDIIGYAITSPSGTLAVDAWNSLNDQGDAGWTESNARADSIAELSESSSRLFENGVSVSLGEIYGGTQDLQFQYGTLEGGPALGTVEYVLNIGGGSGPTCADVAASRAIPGDLDGNNAVEFADFLSLSGSFGLSGVGYEQGDIDCNGTVEFADFLVLSGNFGETAGGAASVPEPSTLALSAFGLIGILLVRRRQGLN